MTLRTKKANRRSGWWPRWVLATLVGAAACDLLSGAAMAQSAIPNTRAPDYQRATGEPARVRFVRNTPSIVQDLVMGPEATLFWSRLQKLINKPPLENLSEVLDVLDLQVTLPMEEVDRRKPNSQWRNDLKDSAGLIKNARYGIGIGSPPFPKERFFALYFNFNTELICLSKQEIQRVFSTEFEQAGVHSVQVMWPDKTGTAHGFHIVDPRGSSFQIAASGCATTFSVRKVFETFEGKP